MRDESRIIRSQIYNIVDPAKGLVFVGKYLGRSSDLDYFKDQWDMVVVANKGDLISGGNGELTIHENIIMVYPEIEDLSKEQRSTIKRLEESLEEIL
tara:strand:- start:185 stop:475 length:291 start_codon:yes stop_codon:yes gene_type:complete